MPAKKKAEAKPTEQDALDALRKAVKEARDAGLTVRVVAVKTEDGVTYTGDL